MILKVMEDEVGHFVTKELMPGEANLEQRLNSVKEIKQVFIKRPSRDTPWAVQEPGCGSTQDV